jgi:hypothetical protein
VTCFLVARDREPNVFHGSDHAISRLVLSSSTAVCYNSHSHCRPCPDFWWLICSLQKWWIRTVLVLFVCMSHSMCPHMFGSNTFCCSKDPWANCWIDIFIDCTMAFEFHSVVHGCTYAFHMWFFANGLKDQGNRSIQPGYIHFHTKLAGIQWLVAGFNPSEKY